MLERFKVAMVVQGAPVGPVVLVVLLAQARMVRVVLGGQV